MSRDLNGNGLTSKVGLVNGKAPRAAKEAVLAAVLCPGVRVIKARYKGEKLILEVPIEDVVAVAAASRPTPRRKQRVVTEPFEVLERRLPAEPGTPRWW